MSGYLATNLPPHILCCLGGSCKHQSTISAEYTIGIIDVGVASETHSHSMLATMLTKPGAGEDS